MMAWSKPGKGKKERCEELADEDIFVDKDRMLLEYEEDKRKTLVLRLRRKVEETMKGSFYDRPEKEIYKTEPVYHGIGTPEGKQRDSESGDSDAERAYFGGDDSEGNERGPGEGGEDGGDDSRDEAYVTDEKAEQKKRSRCAACNKVGCRIRDPECEWKEIKKRKGYHERNGYKPKRGGRGYFVLGDNATDSH